MSNYTLEPASLLGGISAQFGDTTLAECTSMALVSIAVPLDGDAAFETALKNAYGIARPAAGQSAVSTDGNTRIVALGPDQLFALFEHETPDANSVTQNALNGAAYTTDQTDNWVCLRLSGPGALKALERICPIDLHPTVFGVGAAARTAMEHLGSLIIREGEDSYLLCSASSSARSFLHAVETSIHNASASAI